MILTSEVKRPEEVDDSFQRLGKHFYRIDGDMIWMFQVGQLELDEVITMFQLGYQLQDRYGYMLILGSARYALPPSAAARRYQVDQIKVRNVPSHTAIYGANFVMRTMVTLTQRATELITGQPPPMSFVKDEAAARACLDTARAAFQLKLKAS
jgi:hypothetical protein